jgi:hypothetical protein
MPTDHLSEQRLRCLLPLLGLDFDRGHEEGHLTYLVVLNLYPSYRIGRMPLCILQMKVESEIGARRAFIPALSLWRAFK